MKEREKKNKMKKRRILVKVDSETDNITHLATANTSTEA